MINVIPARRSTYVEIDGFNIELAPKPDPGDNELEFCDICWQNYKKVVVIYEEDAVVKICEPCVMRMAEAIRKVD
jgi:hypothetical protein